MNLLQQRVNLIVVSIGISLIVLGVYLFSSTGFIYNFLSQTIGHLLGIFFIIIGVQSALWAIGIRIEILGTSVNVAENKPTQIINYTSINNERDYNDVFYSIPSLLKELENKISFSEERTLLTIKNEKVFKDFIVQSINENRLIGDISVEKILAISSEIEVLIWQLSLLVDSEKLSPSPNYSITKLVSAGVVSEEILPPFKLFWTLRNNIVHNSEVVLNEDQIRAFVDLGIRLKILVSSPSETISNYKN